jgi:hypothetical protein
VSTHAGKYQLRYPLRVLSLVEFIDAAVDTRYVSGPFEERGGLMLVAFPGSFKTTIVRAAVDHHSDALITSDLNVQQWMKIREDFITGRYNTLAFVDFEKLYQRHSSTSSHIEGIIKGLVAEGYGTSPMGDQRMPTPLSQAIVIGAMTSSCFEQRYAEWQQNGFLRRFLWLVVSVHNINEVSKAIKRWEKISFGRIVFKPVNKQIPMQLPTHIEALIENMMREQAGYNGTAYILLKKIAAVLHWKYDGNGAGRKAQQILEEIAPALSKKGGKIVL